MEKQQRFCLTLDLQEDASLIEEYKYWHLAANIWPEIPQGIKEVGIQSMEIFLLDSRLFMIIEADASFDYEKNMERLSSLPRQKEWEDFVARFQKTIPGAKSKEKWRRMERIFSLD